MHKLLLYFFLIYTSFTLKAQFYNPLVDSIPMRDGKKLAADIYIPQGTQARSTILIQTPYNRLFYRYSLPLGIGLNLDSFNYNFVIVDWRGFYGSAQAYTASPNRGEDGYDVIDWIITQSWSNGKVGTWGPSALGKVQYQTAREHHPSHICAVPLVAGSQFNYTEYFPNGVYRKEYVDQLDALGYGLSPFLLANPYYNTLWQYVENENYYPGEITIPMLLIGGWYDHNTELMLELFEGLRNQSPAGQYHKLLMGPWAHGGFGQSQVGSAQQGELYYYEAEGWSDSLAMMFFDYYLQNINNGWDTTAVIQYFQMGENIWENTNSWPPSGINNYNLYLHSNMTLLPQIPSYLSDSVSYIYNPRDPSPSYGGECLRNDLLQGPYNQADTVEARNDILVFTSPVLTQNTIMKGAPKVHLFVSSDRKDTDFAIRLTDVYPDGKSMLLSEGIFRMRFRNGFTTSDTSSIIPGNVYEINIDLKNQAHTFLSGHQIRLDISSSNYPRFDINLNNGGALYTAGDTLIANNKIFTGSNYQSYITLPLLNFPLQSEKNKIQVKKFKVFPIPANNYINIEPTDKSINNYTVSLYDITGKLILRCQVSQGCL